jgi:hypothetical protein
MAKGNETIGQWKVRKRAQWERIKAAIPNAELDKFGDYGTRFGVKVSDTDAYIIGQLARPERGDTRDIDATDADIDRIIGKHAPSHPHE